MSSEVIRVIDNIFAIAALIACILFLVVYGICVDWKVTKYGGHLVRFMLACTLAIGLRVIAIFWRGELLLYLGTVAWFFIALVLWSRFKILLIEQGILKIGKSSQSDSSASQTQTDRPS